MKKMIIITIAALIPVSLSALQPYHEISMGYSQDFGVSLGLRLEDNIGDLPLFLQARAGYVYQEDPGNATEARHIFINDNEGGTVEEYGESYQLALDLGWRAFDWDKLSLEFTLSGLWNHYRAHFAFVGNNESFTVKTSPFGVGGGGALRLPFSEKGASILVKSGLEYYPKARIDAHGTYYYTPDSEDDRPRNDYTYEDADAAINQPDFRFYFQVGILYPIGG